jgi:hypothetical protein
VRWPTELELKATSVLKVPIEEASAKIRTGGPVDDEEDYTIDIWAGVLPLELVSGQPIEDERLTQEIELPKYIQDYKRK